MLQRRISAFVIASFLLCIVCAGVVLAKSAAVVGMVTEIQGHAYWQNDSKKNRIQELAELPENAKLVLAKGSKLVVVYLESGQQYELNGPALVQFRNSKPVALSGTMPRTIGATPVLTDKKRIDPKSVQTAGQTLVSTEAKADPNMPVAVAAPPPPPPPAPPPPPPAMMAPSPAPAPAAIETIAAAREREQMEAYASARRAEEARMAAARQAETAALASQMAEMKAAEAAAAKSAEHGKEKRGAEPKLEPECPPPTADDSTGISGAAKCGDIED